MAFPGQSPCICLMKQRRGPLNLDPLEDLLEDERAAFKPVDDRSNAMEEVSDDFLGNGPRQSPLMKSNLQFSHLCREARFSSNPKLLGAAHILEPCNLCFFKLCASARLKHADFEEPPPGDKLLSLLMVRAMLASATGFLRPRWSLLVVVRRNGRRPQSCSCHSFPLQRPLAYFGLDKNIGLSFNLPAECRLCIYSWKIMRLCKWIQLCARRLADPLFFMIPKLCLCECQVHRNALMCSSLIRASPAVRTWKTDPVVLRGKWWNLTASPMLIYLIWTRFMFWTALAKPTFWHGKALRTK